MIKFKHKGKWNKTTQFFGLVLRSDYLKVLDKYAQEGLEALSKSTPVDSGETASKWGYEIHRGLGHVRIDWTNSHINDGVNIAIILQYGHGTGTGGYVSGRDYINPAMRPVFDNIAEKVWREVASK